MNRGRSNLAPKKVVQDREGATRNYFLPPISPALARCNRLDRSLRDQNHEPEYLLAAYAMPKKPKRPSVADLRRAIKLPESKSATRWEIFEAYCRHMPDRSELPVLRQGLRHEDWVVVRAAAQSIAKLGRLDDEDVTFELLDAAGRPDPALGLPQAYSECLDALIAVGADPQAVIDLVHSHFGHRNWAFVRASMQALHRLGTPKALSLLSRIVVFWWPELNKTERRYVETHFPGSVPKPGCLTPGRVSA
jgi:HEAT repeat protein